MTGWPANPKLVCTSSPILFRRVYMWMRPHGTSCTQTETERAKTPYYFSWVRVALAAYCGLTCHCIYLYVALFLVGASVASLSTYS